MKNKFLYIIFFFVALGIFAACEDDEYDIEYQEGYPTNLAGDWYVSEYIAGNVEAGPLYGPYLMTTALKPGDTKKMVIDNIYDSGVRTASNITGSNFSATLADQLEVAEVPTIGEDTISFVTIAEGKVLTEDSIFFSVALYNPDKILLDTLSIAGVRKTGFE